jgi:uncharacterized protein (DUF1697 family)
MATYICFLRGVNIGGKGKVPMTELKSILEDLGFENVKTLLQSGNVVFSATGKPDARKIETAIERAFKYRSDVHLLTPAQLRKIVSDNPYKDAAKKDPGHMVLYVLPEQPEASAKAKLDTIAAKNEKFTIRPNAVYAHFGSGMGHSKLAAAMDRALGVRGTARNWNTVSKVLELAETL